MAVIVWHRRDLRIFDNAALARAGKEDKEIIPLFIIDPFFFREERETCNDRIHFMVDCLEDLDRQYRKRGTSLVIRYGNSKEVLKEIQEKYNAKIFFNRDTNMPFGFQRDASVQDLNIESFDNDGIIRTEYDRRDWKKHIEKYMTSTCHQPSQYTPHQVKSTYNIQQLRKDFPKEKIKVPTGGRSAAIKRLKKFFTTIENYPSYISKPHKAEKYCSRLSAHLSFGCLSVREIFQYIHSKDKRRFFSTRLYWNQHFTQKLEDFKDLPYKTVNPLFEKNYDRLYAYDEKKITAWKEGRTGYPLVDASMRCLVKTGWLNFRMRAMVASFFCHILRQPWKIGADFMHYHLIDADTAINYAQWQMQASLVGVHPHRIYNPTKQIIDNDPQGEFIKEYVEELKDAPATSLYTEPQQQTLLVEYIPPIVNYEKEARKTRELFKELDTLAKQIIRQPHILKRASLSRKKIITLP